MLGDGTGEGVAVGGREPSRPAPAPAGRTATSSRFQTISMYVCIDCWFGRICIVFGAIIRIQQQLQMKVLNLKKHFLSFHIVK